MEDSNTVRRNVPARKFILRILASWILMVALDLLLNAGIFAKLWLEPNSFLLSPQDLFRRLPLGYIAFLVQAAAYVWLAARIGVRNWKQGALFGLILGVVLNIASVLGLRSGTTASWTMLFAAWLIGGTVLTAGACFVAGFAAEHGEKRALLGAFLFLIGSVILIALLQSTGLVPARRMN